MLPPLDTRKLSALLCDEDEDEELEYDPCGHISIVKELIAEDRNWSEGVMMLLELWPRTNPRFYRKKPLSPRHPLYHKGGPNNWWIDLSDAYFGTLRLKPSSGGVINIYAFGERAQFFQIMGCRKNWAAMIEWIWHYGNKIAMLKSKQKVSKSHTKAHGQRRRIEQPLLHQVLHTAKFKAQCGERIRMADVAVASEKTDLEIDDVDACDTAPDAAKPYGRTGLALQTRDMSDHERTPGVTVEDINIGALEVVDHDSRED